MGGQVRKDERQIVALDTGKARGTGGLGREGVLPEVLARRTGFLLSKAGQLAHEEFGRAIELLGLKPRHYGVLAVLADEGPHAQRDLGEKLRVDRSTMVALVDGLEEMGLVERRRDREDRRRYELTLTEAGGRALSEAEAVVEGVQEAVLGPLDDAGRRALHDLLTALLGGFGRGAT